MPESEILNSIKEIGGVFKLGSGVLGKSAIAVGILLIAVIVGTARLHSDAAILGAIGLGIAAFFVWLFCVLKFAGDHPDIAVLEGGEWSGYQRFQASAKGLIVSQAEERAVSPIGPEVPLQITDKPKQSEEEPSS